MPGVKGRRVPGRPGRFDPTIPLHMTTRRKAAKPNPETGIYPDDEYDETDSRRTSLDEISVTTPNSGFGSAEPPAKRQRTADPSPQQSTVSFYGQEDHSMNRENASSGLFDERHDAHQVASGSQNSSGEESGPAIDVDASQASIDPPPDNICGPARSHAASLDDSVAQGGSERDQTGYDMAETQPFQSQQEYEGTNGIIVDAESTVVYTSYEPTKTHHPVNDTHQSGDPGDWVKAVHPLPSAAEFESREVSVESSRSDVRAVQQLPLPEVSTDATPMATRQGSPATTASAAAEELTPARSKGVDNYDVRGSDDEVDEEGDDAEPVTEFQETIENMEDDAEDTRYADDYEEDDAPARKTTKRKFAGGRRRAAHSNTKVEAAMRRQLEIKQIYRQTTRAMKACLAELAQITLDELQTDPQHHTQVEEYESVIAELDEQLARRKQQLLNAQNFNHEQLLQRYDAETYARKNRCRNYLEDIKEQQLVNLEYNMLQVNRRKLREEAKPGHETEDEDGVIPRPKKMGYRYKRSSPIDLRYDSRSRFTMETERSVDDLQRRTNMWEALKAYDPEAAEAFTVMDSAAREAAEERRRNVGITSSLADIAVEYDRMQNAPRQAPPPPTAEELAPLNALAELAAKPALPSQRSTGRGLQPSPQQTRSPLPSQSLLERSTGAPPPHQSPFLRLAMEQTRSPKHGLGASPISAMLAGIRQSEDAAPKHGLGISPISAMMAGIRPLEDTSNPSSATGARNSDGRTPLAAKPALHSQESNGRSQPSTPHTTQPTEQQIRETMAGLPSIHPDRGRLMAMEIASKANAQSDNQPSGHSFQSSNTGQQDDKASLNGDNQSQASRQAFSLPPHQAAARAGSTASSEIKLEQDSERLSRKPSASGAEHSWKGPVTSRSDRDGASRRQSGLRPRAKRHREDDPSDGIRNQRPRAATASLDSQRRPRSSNANETEEERLRARLAMMSPRSRRIAGIVDDEITRNAVASSDLGDHPPSDRHRRLSSQSYRGRRPSIGAAGSGPNRRASDNHRPPPFQQGPPPPSLPPGFPAHPPFMTQPGWPNGSFYGQPPMHAPTAQPINHFAMSQGFNGAAWGQGSFQPGSNPPPPPPPFRDYFGRR